MSLTGDEPHSEPLWAGPCRQVSSPLFGPCLSSRSLAPLGVRALQGNVMMLGGPRRVRLKGDNHLFSDASPLSSFPILLHTCFGSSQGSPRAFVHGTRGKSTERSASFATSQAATDASGGVLRANWKGTAADF